MNYPLKKHIDVYRGFSFNKAGWCFQLFCIFHRTCIWDDSRKCEANYWTIGLDSYHPNFIWFLVLISETSIEFSLASGVISSMANHGKSPSKSHWPMLFLLKDARWLRRFLNGVPHFVWCDWCNLYKTPMFIIYNCLYIYIRATPGFCPGVAA